MTKQKVLPGQSVSPLSHLTSVVKLSERLKLRVTLPIHDLEMNDNKFMDNLMNEVNSLRLPGQKSGLKSFGDMSNYLVHGLAKAVNSMTGLQVHRQVTMTLESETESITITRTIDLRRDGLPSTLLRIDHTQETLFTDWTTYRSKLLGQVHP